MVWRRVKFPTMHRYLIQICIHVCKVQLPAQKLYGSLYIRHPNHHESFLLQIPALVRALSSSNCWSFGDSQHLRHAIKSSLRQDLWNRKKGIRASWRWKNINTNIGLEGIRLHPVRSLKCPDGSHPLLNRFHCHIKSFKNKKRKRRVLERLRCTFQYLLCCNVVFIFQLSVPPLLEKHLARSLGRCSLDVFTANSMCALKQVASKKLDYPTWELDL